MWTYVEKKDIDAYVSKYPQLAEDFESLSLYETNDAIFLPRLFYKNFPALRK